ncbi:DUF3710 domain-containing protein [Nonomuraea sp. NPDC002799]
MDTSKPGPLDFGALRLPLDPYLARAELATDDAGIGSELSIFSAGSVLRLCAYATPGGGHLWNEQCAEIQAGFFRDGDLVEPVDGEFGVELQGSRLRRRGIVRIRIVGVVGPGYLVRGVVEGPAAADPDEAPALLMCLRDLDVRVPDPPPAEQRALPLRLPPELAAVMVAEAAKAPELPAPAPRPALPGRASPAERAAYGDLQRNALCACGSGRKYKRCHEVQNR